MPFFAVLPEAPGWLLLFFFQLGEGTIGGVSAFSFSTMTLTSPRIEVISNKLMCYLIYCIPITLFQTSGGKENHIFLDLILVRISLIRPLLQSINCRNFKNLIIDFQGLTHILNSSMKWLLFHFPLEIKFAISAAFPLVTSCALGNSYIYPRNKHLFEVRESVPYVLMNVGSLLRVSSFALVFLQNIYKWWQRWDRCRFLSENFSIIAIIIHSIFFFVAYVAALVLSKRWWLSDHLCKIVTFSFTISKSNWKVYGAFLSSFCRQGVT